MTLLSATVVLGLAAFVLFVVEGLILVVRGGK